MVRGWVRGDAVLVGFRSTDLDVSEGGLATMLLQENVSVGPFTEIRNIAVLAGRHRVTEFPRPALEFDSLAPIQPELDMLTAGNDPRVVPLSHGLEDLVLCRGDQVVKCTYGPVPVAAELCIRVELVVEDLELKPDRGTDGRRLPGFLVDGGEIGLDEDLDAAVAAGRDPEINTEFEVRVLLTGYDVASFC